MHLIRYGFDGLDLAYNLSIPEDLAQQLEEQRAVADAEDRYLGLIQRHGVSLIVHATGAKGGYAFRCDSGLGGPLGELWLFKRPTERKDPWGVRVSCRALPLALDGLAKVRQRIEATMAALGMSVKSGDEAIARVDVACDILAPDFVADRNCVVAHSQTTIKDITPDMMQVVGRSGRLESITIGKNPGRQVVIYDKRAEVIAMQKPYWWPIWDAALAEQGLPPLDPKDRANSAVWRVELRLYKRHLKDKWRVSTWGDLRDKLPEMLHYTLCDIRYTQPSNDSNRARWPDHPIWGIAHDAFGRDMADLASMADRAVIDDMLRSRSDEALRAQITSCLLSRAALHRVADGRIDAFALGTCQQLIRDWKRYPERHNEKLARARVRYGSL